MKPLSPPIAFVGLTALQCVCPFPGSSPDCGLFVLRGCLCWFSSSTVGEKSLSSAAFSFFPLPPLRPPPWCLYSEITSCGSVLYRLLLLPALCNYGKSCLLIFSSLPSTMCMYYVVIFLICMLHKGLFGSYWLYEFGLQGCDFCIDS